NPRDPAMALPDKPIQNPPGTASSRGRFRSGSKLHCQGSDRPGAALRAGALRVFPPAGTRFPATGTSPSAREDGESPAADSPGGRAGRSTALDQIGPVAGSPALQHFPVRKEYSGTAVAPPRYLPLPRRTRNHSVRSLRAFAKKNRRRSRHPLRSKAQARVSTASRLALSLRLAPQLVVGIPSDRTASTGW